MSKHSNEHFVFIIEDTRRRRCGEIDYFLWKNDHFSRRVISSAFVYEIVFFFIVVFWSDDVIIVFAILIFRFFFLFFIVCVVFVFISMKSNYRLSLFLYLPFAIFYAYFFFVSCSALFIRVQQSMMNIVKLIFFMLWHIFFIYYRMLFSHRERQMNLKWNEKRLKIVFAFFFPYLIRKRASISFVLIARNDFVILCFVNAVMSVSDKQFIRYVRS